MRLALMLLVLGSCQRHGESSIPDCPPEATVQTDQLGTEEAPWTRMECRWDTRKTITITDARGDVIEESRTWNGLLDGPQIWWDPDRQQRSESAYRRGVPHGWFRTLRGDDLVHECHYIDGIRDGFCWSDSPGGLSSFEHYDRGRRTGFWWTGSEGQVGWTWIYGDDILLAIGGRPVPLPRPSIEVDGAMIWRTRCPLVMGTDPCRKLFDDFQVCELDPSDRASCRARAIESYRQENALKERRRQRPGSPTVEF